MPLLDQNSVKYVMTSNYALGIIAFAMISVADCLTSLHRVYYLEPKRVHVNTIAHSLVERYTLDRLEQVSHVCQKKLLDGDYNNKKNAVKWELINFIRQTVENLIQLIPIAGYMVWISYWSPFTVITYVCGICLYLRYMKSESVKWEDYDNTFDSYNIHRHNQYSDLIHGKGEHCHNKMSEYMSEFEQIKGKDTIYNAKYIEGLNCVFGVITIINCYVVLSASTDPVSILLYIQYIRLLKNSLQTMANMFKQYKAVEKEYLNFVKIFDDTLPAGEVDQVAFNNDISIDKNSYFIRNGKMALSFQDNIVLKRGNVVYIEGKSGAGKTTFFDIISGVIRHNQTGMIVRVDGKSLENGFEQLKVVRTYLATDIRINSHKTSIYQIVISGRSDANTRYIFTALEMAMCTFATADNLHNTDSKFSKGELNRLKVARYLYDILADNPAFVLLDEIADGVDPDNTIKIAENIYKYFRENNILCLVTTHLPYLQSMSYDMHVKAVDGRISL